MLRSTAIAIAVGLTVKAALFFWIYLSAGLTPLALMSGHDGAEYLQYAKLIGTGSTGALPPDVLRHDPGLPLALSALWLASARLLSLPACALLLQVIAWLTGIILFARLYSHWSANAPFTCRASVIAAAIGYPASLYYSHFNLTEPLFTAMILGSILLAVSEKFLLAILLAGLSALVRSTGLLLVVALLLTHPAVSRLLHNPRPALRLAGYAAVGLAPWLLSQVTFQFAFETNFSTHKPRFGLPFSGFRGISDAGLVRAIYILGAVTFFIISTAGLTLAAKKAHWNSSLKNAAAAFTAIFLIFHLCLKTLYYIDREVWTFDYQDRYLVPLWPLAILLWSRWINWPIASTLIAISAAMSAYWLRNYIQAAPL